MEKFGLLNLIQALSNLSAPPRGTDAAKTEPDKGAPAPPAPDMQTPPAAYPNVMASVLERHEQIANRVRNKPQK